MRRFRTPHHGIPTPTAFLFPLLFLAACEEPIEERDLPGQLIENVGFQTPESVQHDRVMDVYLVSNINGSPVERAGNGFISRLSPDGDVLDLKWIDGEAEGIELNAPKGMAIRGQVLYVADIDYVRGFDHETGEPVEEIRIEGATFLNGLAVDESRGILYVSDTGMGMENGELVPTGTDAVYEIAVDGEVSVLAQGEELGGPNGLAYSERGLIVGAFRTGQLYALQPGGEMFEMMPASERQIDGVLSLPDRGFLFSDWDQGNLIRILPDGTMESPLEGIQAPADLGFDETRSRVLIPLFMDDAVLLMDIELEQVMP